MIFHCILGRNKNFLLRATLFSFFFFFGGNFACIKSHVFTSFHYEKNMNVSGKTLGSYQGIWLRCLVQNASPVAYPRISALNDDEGYFSEAPFGFISIRFESLQDHMSYVESLEKSESLTTTPNTMKRMFETQSTYMDTPIYKIHSLAFPDAHPKSIHMTLPKLALMEMYHALILDALTPLGSDLCKLINEYTVSHYVGSGAIATEPLRRKEICNFCGAFIEAYLCLCSGCRPRVRRLKRVRVCDLEVISFAQF